MISIDKYAFNTESLEEVKKLHHGGNDVGTNWPVVYVLNNSKEAYVGETLNAYRRLEQHLQNPDRQGLDDVHIVSDKTFNKSVILDLESYLIRYMSSDGKFSLQNGNNGIRDHAYYSKEQYEEQFKDIWEKLRRKGLVKNSIDSIENSELYKYSPYKILGEDQIEAEKEILRAFAEYKDSPGGASIVVRGGAGTGKTILAIYLMKLFADLARSIPKDEETEIDEYAELVDAAHSIEGITNIGLVIPQKSLMISLRDVFGGVKNLKPDMVMTPAEVVKNYFKTGKKYDLLIVDESHRLKCRNHGHLSNYRTFDKCNADLGLDKYTGTELDWIMLCSNNRILFRDELQMVRPCDIPTDDFYDILENRYVSAVVQTGLTTQWRCQGGNSYISYLKEILSGQCNEKKDVLNYDLRLYNDCDLMIEHIKAKEKELGLCRVVAGYAWPWDRKRTQDYTILVQGKKYRWNMTYENWISTKTAIDEIGCIHTVQGYDLNYCGVIIGEDIKYNPMTHEIYADKDNYYDQQGKAGVAFKPKELRDYLINIYLTLMTRGIKGTYIYACNDELREYLKGLLLEY